MPGPNLPTVASGWTDSTAVCELGTSAATVALGGIGVATAALIASDFNLSVPNLPGLTIDGIFLELVDTIKPPPVGFPDNQYKVWVALSADGASWTAARSFDASATRPICQFGGAADDWGGGWAWDTNYRVKVWLERVLGSDLGTIGIDALRLSVTYSSMSGGSGGGGDDGGGGGSGGGGVDGTSSSQVLIGGDANMTRHIGDHAKAYLLSANYSTGAATDCADLPTYAVYEDGTDLAILTGTMSKMDDSGTIGFYKVEFDVSVANGFEVDKTYVVLAFGTVASVDRTWKIAEFVVRESLDADVSLTRKMLTNKMQSVGSILTTYDDDGTTPVSVQQISDMDTGFVRGKTL